MSTKYSGGVMLWYTSAIRSGSAYATREARDPIEKWWIRMLSGWLASFRSR